MSVTKGTLSGAERIAIERARQLMPQAAGGEGWDARHDAGHAEQLARAGATYALPPNVQPSRRDLWPWQARWWKPTPDDRIRELEKAGALIAAAIDDLLARS